jgi:hypothetical protein
MNLHDPDSLRLMTRERHERRLREGDAGRPARFAALCRGAASACACR